MNLTVRFVIYIAAVKSTSRKNNSYNEAIYARTHAQLLFEREANGAKKEYKFIIIVEQDSRYYPV